MITGLNHLTLAVADVERSFEFYATLLGCRPEARWDRGAYLSAGGLWLCLSLDAVRPAGDYTHVAFGVSPGTFDEAVARLVAAGVVSWKDNASEGASFYFLDPDGHKLELHDGDLASRLAAVDRVPYAGWMRFGRGDTKGGGLEGGSEGAGDDGSERGPSLRVADAADVPVIERCARAAYGKYVERIGREPAPMVADFATAIGEGRVRVIERDGRVAGYAVVEHRADELHLENVAVFPECAGDGLGRQLVASVEDEAHRLGLARLTLYTNAAMHENLALYPRLGYVEIDRRREDGFDRVYFEKTLRNVVDRR